MQWVGCKGCVCSGWAVRVCVQWVGCEGCVCSGWAVRGVCAVGGL